MKPLHVLPPATTAFLCFCGRKSGDRKTIVGQKTVVKDEVFDQSVAKNVIASRKY